MPNVSTMQNAVLPAFDKFEHQLTVTVLLNQHISVLGNYVHA